MNPYRNEPIESRISDAIAVWENEGGATDDQYGRRIESDRSWTIYNVFTGVPADIGGLTMTGLSKPEATDGMLSLNLRNEERRKIGANAPSMWLSTLDAMKSWR
ncbi:hypothetical protein L598_000700000550 [Mesorhizobium sp. J18]|uniref:hypothetical protein n=1 Tax=Mesorhizobium sp. J18 TaxID=935263 RepID=UPI00119A8BA1|nr:hypothetical protein [Mesorhizobium sp. J18]TWG90299.1 hypothetical protein L598_000700000550 [Mesorhizobium sp. J18]